MYLLVEKGIIKRAKPKGSILEIADNTRERKESTEATKDSTEAIKDNIEGTKDSTETTTLLKTLVEQQKEVIRMLSTVITQTSKAVPTSIAVSTSAIAPQAIENLPSSSGLPQLHTPSSSHKLPVTSMPTLTDNFFLEDLAEGDKTDLTDDDLALLSSPSLIAYSDQSYSHYESDTLPSTSMQVPPAPSALPQLQPLQYPQSQLTPQFPPQVPAQISAQFPSQPAQLPPQPLAQLPVQQPSSPIHPCPPPPPFSTPPKLRPVDEVIRDHPGSDVSVLRELTTALAREAIFGREELSKCSLSGRKNTISLNKRKLEYIKSVVRSRIPNKSGVEFELIWKLCRSSLSKSCQTIRTNAKKKN